MCLLRVTGKITNQNAVVGHDGVLSLDVIHYAHPLLQSRHMGCRCFRHLLIVLSVLIGLRSKATELSGEAYSTG